MKKNLFTSFATESITKVKVMTEIISEISMVYISLNLNVYGCVFLIPK